MGMEAQKAAVAKHIGGGELLAEFVEVETGKKNGRAQLAAALKMCKATGATLVIAKLDRLSRNAAFVLELQAAGVPFICCDNPHANALTISLLAVIAQHEREQIASRTKAALDVKRATTGEWRKGKITSEARELAQAGVKLAAATNEHTLRARGYAVALSAQGLTLAEIAARLNNEGHKTARGGAYQATQVGRLLGKYSR